MLTSITLRNYKSFGREARVPLEPITALVGPNNSGKSVLLGVSRFVRNAVSRGADAAIEAEGGAAFLFHRPPEGAAEALVSWETDAGSYRSAIDPTALREDRVVPGAESLDYADGSAAWNVEGDLYRMDPRRVASARPFAALALHCRTSADDPVAGPMVRSRLVHLVLDQLRRDSDVVESPVLMDDGEGLAAVLGYWRGADIDRADELDGFLRSCVPEVKRFLVKPAPAPGKQRLWFAQNDGVEFDGHHVSDGLLCFTALATHVIAAPKGTVFFVEEPEQSVHPRRLHHLLDLMRKAVRERGCQFVLATHSPVLLDEMSDEPERIVMFRRGAAGTEVTRCTDLPRVQEALETSTPGELLETAFFEGLWPEDEGA